MNLIKKPLAVVILAAGKGTRMKSTLPKVLHPLLGQPMLQYVLDAARGLRPFKNILVIGHQADRVAKAFPKWPGIFIHQVPQLGTGHALQVTRKELESFRGTVMVLSGDVPLIKKGTLKKLLQVHARSQAALTLISTEVRDPNGYGRIIRDSKGQLLRIVEEKDATPQERSLREINSGLYCFDSEFLFSALSGLTRKNRQKEYYLTDLVTIAREKRRPAAAFLHPRSEEVLGINDRAELARSSQVLRQRTLKELMVQGVTVLDPTTTYIESAVRIGPDTVIGPFTSLLGKTRIGSHCDIQSHVVIDSTTIKDGTTIPPFSYLKKRT
jgi:bifunctional UDP-N-acetylglucosamine pyrophosphorylase / glucosamine-1-phosphate N-acetyltransferase